LADSVIFKSSAQNWITHCNITDKRARALQEDVAGALAANEVTLDMRNNAPFRDVDAAMLAEWSK
jgi:hypothetical protein